MAAVGAKYLRGLRTTAAVPRHTAGNTRHTQTVALVCLISAVFGLEDSFAAPRFLNGSKNRSNCSFIIAKLLG